jgi:uncharacterized phage infection (PIP) family protein YhgE
MTSAAKVLSLTVVAALAGCTDLKPTQASIDDLKGQVANLRPTISSAESSAQAASAAASKASQTAGNAQSTANQALSLAKTNQTAIEAINEKIDRMFKRSVSK